MAETDIDPDFFLFRAIGEQRQFHAIGKIDHLYADIGQLLPRYDSTRLAQLRQGIGCHRRAGKADIRSEEHTSELQSLMRISYAVFCLKKKNTQIILYYTTLI